MTSPEEVKKNLNRRHFKTTVIDELADMGKKRTTMINEVEALKAKRNEISKQVGQKKKAGEDASADLNEVGEVGREIESLDDGLSTLERTIEDHLLSIPNLVDDSIPDGKSEADNKEIRKHGEPVKLAFDPKDHSDLGETLGLLDFKRGAKITGSRFTLYWANAAQLERALINFMLDLHTTQHGYTEVLPPFIVNENSLRGTCQLPKFKEDLFRLDISDSEYYLIPTAEVPVTNIHADEILDDEQLPCAYTAYTPCFRSEAGSYGKDTKGLIRQHQFNKVELVRFCRPEESMKQLDLLTSHAEEVLKLLGLHYRVIDLCAGDIGFGSAKTYDIEVWLPGQKAYREISSCSNYNDFQARRAKIRYRPHGEKKPQLLHTLNGSALAVGRTLVAIFENYQDEGGRIAIPEKLQPYMGGKTHL